MAEDAAEGLTEHPDHEPPAQRSPHRRPGTSSPGEPPTRRCPHRPGSTPWRPLRTPGGRTRWCVPALTRLWTQPGDEEAAGVMTDPGRPSGIGRLQLQQAVEQPQEAEGEAEEAAGRRLGVRPRLGHLDVCRARGHRPPVVHGTGDVPGQRQQYAEDDQDQELVVEGRTGTTAVMVGLLDWSPCPIPGMCSPLSCWPESTLLQAGSPRGGPAPRARGPVRQSVGAGSCTTYRGLIADRQGGTASRSGSAVGRARWKPRPRLRLGRSQRALSAPASS